VNALARLGKRVAMAERVKLGGSCLHVGYVPSEALMRAAIVGAHACALIGELAVAMAERGSAWRVSDTQHSYPTLSPACSWPYSIHPEARMRRYCR
jgi:pyruvate/2-oxoglutarate dehydrogenase complex dihydrolipoamide dehydrogenase (E3) component